MEKKHHLSLLAMNNIMKEVSVLRVSDEAKDVMRDVLEDYAREITKKAELFARHAKRRTIKAEDVDLALKDLKR